jgi:hypothetical protein
MGYEGQLINEIRHGEGKQLYTNGDMFEGYFVGDQVV